MTSKIVTLTYTSLDIPVASDWEFEEEAEIDDNTPAFYSMPPDGQTGLLAGVISADQIPEGATIDGIEFYIKKQQRIDYLTTYDTHVTIANNGGAIGDNKADTVNKWPNSYQYFTYGGSTDMWGTTLTANDINSGDIAVGIAGTKIGGSLWIFMDVDYIRITVYYTEGVTPPAGENPYGPLIQVI
jgi:hypothetical protein